MSVTANQLEVRAFEMLELRVVLPRLWKPRLWAAGRLMLLAGWIAGIGTTVELVDKK